MIFDNDELCIVSNKTNEELGTEGYGFEIVNKITNTESFYHPVQNRAVAKMIQTRIKEWQIDTPDESEVVEFFMKLEVQNLPLVMH